MNQNYYIHKLYNYYNSYTISIIILLASTISLNTLTPT